MIYLIDFENVHEDGFSAIGRLGEKDSVYCFFTRNVAKISMSALAGMRSGQLHFVEAESGKQSLDLALVSFLGYLIGTKPQEQCYEIVSNDNGFQKAADFWNKRGMGLRVRVRKTNVDVRASQKQPAAQPQPAPAAMPAQEPQQEVQPAQPSRRRQTRAGQRRTARQAAAQAAVPTVKEPEAKPEETKPALPPVPEEAVPAQEPQETPVEQPQEAPAAETPAAAPAEERQQPDPAILAALEAAGIEHAAAEYLISQAERYQNESNLKQLVYRAVVRKYGQKTGTQIYNTAKKIVMK